MDISGKRKIAAILQVLAEAGRPLGSTRIAQELGMAGIDLKQRMIRYYLHQMDASGFTQNLGRRGRRITDLGTKELESAVIVDKVGFISAKVDEMAYQMSFDIKRGAGTIILNISSVPTSKFKIATKVIKEAFEAGTGMGKYIAVASEGDELGGYRPQEGEIAIGTVCSVTLNGVLRAAGIAMSSRFGGLLELSDGQPVRFVHIINYDGTTLDPIEVFIKGGMTNVSGVAQDGSGVIGASFREIPTPALPTATRIIKKMAQIGLGGVLLVGGPSQPLLDIPVAHGRVGIIVAAGLNPIAAVEEAGIKTQNRAMARLYEFERLTTVDETLEKGKIAYVKKAAN